MLLSDAIEQGAAGLGTPGPSFAPKNDALYAAFRGFFGRDPTTEEDHQFYHNKHFGFGTDTEYALRIMTIYKCRWAEVIKRLRATGQ